MKVDAVLPAGGRIHGAFARETGVEIKALIPLAGQSVLERILSALRATGRVDKAVVIGPDEVASHPAVSLADAVLSEGGNSGPANIFKGLNWLYKANGEKHADKVLVVTTDIPLITPEAINEFIDSCPTDVDLCLPLISREEFEERFPDMSLTYVRLKDGWWTIGCAFLINPIALMQNRRVIEGVFAARKSHILMARLLGPMFILRYLSGRLTVAHIEERCSYILGCFGKAVRGCSPELVLDIDRPVEYHYILKKLAQETPE